MSLAVVLLVSAAFLGFLPRANARGIEVRAQLTPLGARAYDVLAHADEFEYVDGNPSNRACAFHLLLREPHGDAAFRALLEEPAVIATLYGLAGTWHREPASFARHPREVDQNAGHFEARAASGCTRVGLRVRDILYVDGAIQIAPGGSLLDIEEPVGVFSIDVAGGGVPEFMKGKSSCAYPLE